MQLLYRLVTALIIVSILSGPSWVNGALADQDQHEWLHTLLIAANTQVDLTESDATSGRDTRVAQLRIVQPNDDTQTMYVGIPS